MLLFCDRKREPVASRLSSLFFAAVKKNGRLQEAVDAS